MALFEELLLVSLALTGALAGMSLDQSIKQLPARHLIGANAYSAYSRSSDLRRNGIGLYAFFGVGSAAACTGLALLAWRSPDLEASIRTAAAISGLLAIAHSLCTTVAAPTLFSQRRVAQPTDATVARIFDKFALWQNLRCGLQVGNFTTLLVVTALAIRL
jgi:hypothetical protein